MRKFLVGCLFSIILIFIIGLYLTTPKKSGLPPRSTNSNSSAPSPSEQQPEKNLKTVTVNGKQYTYGIIGPVKPSLVSLISNLPQKQLTSQLKNQIPCASLTSAGFYDTADKHIGLFQTNDTVISKETSNSLFQTIIWSAADGQAGIQSQKPEKTLQFALQTGPLLITDFQPRTLALKTDEEARRIAIGMTEDQNFIFYGVFGEHVYTGPLLTDLPRIIQAINTQEGVQPREVVNLDGGSHASFQHNSTIVSEISPVGGIFCIK
jgi:hypothetical protein